MSTYDSFLEVIAVYSTAYAGFPAFRDLPARIAGAFSKKYSEEKERLKNDLQKEKDQIPQNSMHTEWKIWISSRTETLTEIQKQFDLINDARSSSPESFNIPSAYYRERSVYVGLITLFLAVILLWISGNLGASEFPRWVHYIILPALPIALLFDMVLSGWNVYIYIERNIRIPLNNTSSHPEILAQARRIQEFKDRQDREANDKAERMKPKNIKAKTLRLRQALDTITS